MAFVASERLTIWQNLLAAANQRLAEIPTTYPGVDAGLIARIRKGCFDSIKTCEGFIKYYEEKAA